MYLFDYAIESGLKKTESRLYKSWNKILTDSINAEIIILGNSRAYRHFDSRKIQDITGKSTWNLGMDSYSFNIQKMKYDIYKNKNRSPHYLIINVDNHTLNYSEIGYEREQFLPYLNDSSFKNNYYIKNSFSKKEIYIPLLKYFGYRNVIAIGLAEFLNLKHFNDNEFNGFWESFLNWNGNDLENMINNHENIHMVINDRTLENFKEFIQENKANGIKVILVWCPFYKEALKVMSDNKESRIFFNQIANENGILFLDYSNDELSNSKAFFENATHLNRKGAEIFSAKFANEIK